MTTKRYLVTSGDGIYIGETLYAYGSVISLSEASAKYLLLAGLIVLNSGQAPIPTNPDDPSQDDIFIEIRIGSDVNRVSLTRLIQMFPDIKGDRGERGLPGSQGPKGDRGPPGEMGSRGEQGLPGQAGVPGSPGAKGDDGPPGPAGDPGPTGPKGDIGADGATGPQGPRGETGLTGQVGPAGSQGLQGLQGERGDAGPEGPRGAQGLQGLQGPRGEQGLQGPKGDQGDAGPQGAKGDQGVQGNVGPQGDKGDPGIGTRIVGSVANPGNLPSNAVDGDVYTITTTGTGYAAGDGYAYFNGAWNNVGPIRGPVGPQGPAGPQGAQGVVGAKGDQGVAGPQGVPGLQGAKGDQGLQGSKGDQGVPGLQGPKGDQGLQGIQGAKGDQGAAGLQGAKGDQGLQGPKGDQGAPGPQGPQGIQGTKGDTGAKGDSGQQGPQGPQGPAGPDSPVNLTYDRAKNLVDGTDLNTLTKSGFYDGTNLVNSPSVNDWFYVEVTTHSGYNSSNVWLKQTATGLNQDLGSFERVCILGNWTKWRQVATNRELEQRYGLTPFQFMTPTQIAAVRAGRNKVDVSGPLQAWIDALVALSKDRAVRGVWPEGYWYVDKKLNVRLPDQGGLYNGIVIDFAGRHATKIVMGDNNRYRYVSNGYWNAKTNTPNIASFMNDGDALICSVGSDTTTIGLSVNVGDIVYRQNGRWRKILARAKFRGYVDPATNFGQEGSSGNYKIYPNIQEYGDFFICMNDGVFYGQSFSAGDEIYFLGPGNFTKKGLLGGFYQGKLPATGSLPNWGPGDARKFFIVDHDEYNSTRLLTGDRRFMTGANWLTRGDKLWWDGYHFRKVFCSPTPQGSFDPVNMIAVQSMWFASKGNGGDWDRQWEPLRESGTSMGHGDFFVAMTDGNGYRRDDIIYHNGAGWEIIPRDPNYDTGWLHIGFFDYKNSISLRGGWDVISTIDTRLTGNPYAGYTIGPILRVMNDASSVNMGGLNGETTLTVEGMRVLADAEIPGDAQFYLGVVEKGIETRNIYVPKFENCEFRPPSFVRQSSDMNDPAYKLPAGMVYNDVYPRVAVCAIDQVDSYVPQVIHCQANGRWRTGFRMTSDIWDAVTGSSWEGGRAVNINIAECIDGVTLEHNYRHSELVYEPTFELNGMDGKALRYGIRVHQHGGVNITNIEPILEDFPSLLVQDVVAAILIEEATNITISNMILSGGFTGLPGANASDPQQRTRRDEVFTTGILTRYAVGDITVTNSQFGGNGYGVTALHSFNPYVDVFGKNYGSNKIFVVNCTSSAKRLFGKDFDWEPKTGQFSDIGGHLMFDYFDGTTRSVVSNSHSNANGPSFTIDRLRRDHTTYHDDIKIGDIHFRGRDSAGNTRVAARFVGKLNQNWSDNFRGGFAITGMTQLGEEEVVSYDGRTRALQMKADRVGFYNNAPVQIQVVSGTAGSREWAQSLMTALSNMGLVFNSTV